MPLPASKIELLDNIRSAYEKLDHEFADVPSNMEKNQHISGHISCCNTLAYQIGWARLLLGWEATERKGLQPAMPAKGYKWNELGKLAQSFYDESSSKSLKQLRSEFHNEFSNLLQWVESLSEEELFVVHQRQWAGEKWPLVKWIQVNTIAPYRSARTKVRRWKKANQI